ncbi:PIN domain-containing protein [Schaedlerella sp.]|uniref:PIN domain-containing protein n=1 Tax=Schaedlerella sp. TaxID=2676057 RepID=UPI003747776B
MRIYLDNCCYNRPYDDQLQMRIHLDTEAKLHIQDMVKNNELELVTSYMLDYENAKNRFWHKRQAISEFLNENEAYYVSQDRNEEAIQIAEEIKKTGVKNADALHVACAILAKSNYFITTDDRLLKYRSEKVEIVTPGEFVRRVEEKKYE